MLIRDLTRDKREALLAWLQAQGLDPREIADDGYFAVRNGTVRGYKMLLNDEGNLVYYKGEPVTVHFNVSYEGEGPDL